MSTLLRRRWVRVVLTLLAVISLCAALVATLYLNLFDVQWLAFLGGVLFAAVLAIASPVSKAEWRIARRTLQLERAREQVAHESTRSRNATETLRIADARMRLMGDAVPSLVLYVDRDERCRYHNRAVREKTGLPAERIDGRALREIAGYAVYPNIAAHIPAALAGKTVDYEFTWDSPGGEDALYAARHVPHFTDEPQPRGFYLVITRPARQNEPLPAPPAAPPAQPAQPAQQAPRAVDGGSDAPALAEGGETLYLTSISNELMGEEDPRNKLTRALRENQFLLFAQKIVSLKSGSPDPVCYEILLRLQEEEDNLLPPGGFIPVAERYGMMQDLDRWVVRTLIGWCAARLRSDPAWRSPLYCVNLSEAVLDSAEFARFVRAELQRSNIPGRCLTFEISEPDAVSRLKDVTRLMAALRPVGCRLTVEGFGSAKVSFSHLKGLKMDFIKIDGSIIQSMMRDPAELAKLRAISTVCQKIGIKTIAEFVETKETLERVREAGVDYVQGFGIARPARLDDA